MISTNQQTTNSTTPEHQVWSDLRILRTINQLQQQIQTLSQTTTRWRWFTLMLLIASFVTLGISQTLTYAQLMELRNSLPQSNSALER